MKRIGSIAAAAIIAAGALHHNAAAMTPVAAEAAPPRIERTGQVGAVEAGSHVTIDRVRYRFSGTSIPGAGGAAAVPLRPGLVVDFDAIPGADGDRIENLRVHHVPR
ncbi:MAG TPA: hypothetical protein VM491_03075 [Burkholderiaceae bacterium]|nr:hypothetical protein [Burkholderiaceae bacterium]